MLVFVGEYLKQYRRISRVDILFGIAGAQYGFTVSLEMFLTYRVSIIMPLRFKQHLLGGLVALVAFLLIPSLKAATYYVDYANGNDISIGTSTAAPFKHCPGDNSATSIAASTALMSGDSIIFKGGVSYTGQIGVNWSGSNGRAVTYDGNSAGSWGSGKAIIDQQHTLGLTGGFVAGSAKSYITIKNFIIKNVGGYYPVPSPRGCANSIGAPAQSSNGGVVFDQGGSYLTVSDCAFSEIGEWHNTDPFTGNAISGACVWFNDASHVLIASNDFTKSMMGAAIKAQSANITDIEIVGCQFHNYLVWSIDISPRSQGRTLSDIRIHDNQFYNYAEYTSGMWTGCGSAPHVDNIYLRVDYDNTTWTSTKIYNNWFYVENYSGAGGSACIALSQQGGADIFNNVFNNTLHPSIVVRGGPRAGGSSQTNNIFNNTFYNGSSAIVISSQGGAAPIGVIRILNNVFYDIRSGWGFAIDQYDADANPTILDYNLYYFSGSSDHDLIRRPQGILTLSSARVAGYESHGMGADPLFVSIAGGQLNPAINNLSLSATSPAIGAGTNMNAYWRFDRNGVDRGTIWDMGAYQFSGGLQRPVSPFNLRTNAP